MCDLYNRRKIVNKSVLLYPQVKKRKDPPLSLHGQLLWREFFYTVATNNPNFDRMKDNPLCVQIPWDKNPEALAKWAEVNIWGKYEINVHKSHNRDLKNLLDYISFENNSLAVMVKDLGVVGSS